MGIEIKIAYLHVQQGLCLPPYHSEDDDKGQEERSATRGMSCY